MTDTPKTLVAKLAEACDAVGGIEKLGKNEAQGYKYVKAADVAKAIRHELFSRGIVIMPHENPPDFVAVELAPDRDGRPRSMTECHLCVTYSVTDGTETFAYNAYGVARDSGDKAIYKAKTGALKYFLRGLGLIPDEKDDPEFDDTGKEVVRRDTQAQAKVAQDKVERMKAERDMKPAAPVIEQLKASIAAERITPAQKKRMWTIAAKRWIDVDTRDSEMHKLLGHHGFEHSEEVTGAAYDEIIRTIEGEP